MAMTLPRGPVTNAIVGATVLAFLIAAVSGYAAPM